MLTSTVGNLLVRDALLDHFRQNLLFSNVHHGFVPRQPCVRQLLTVMSSILALKKYKI